MQYYEERTFEKGMNTESNPLEVLLGEYIDAENCVNFNGHIQNIKGNIKINDLPINSGFSLPPGRNKMIGYCDNIEANAIIFFLFNSNNNHGIYRLYKSNHRIQAILQNEPVLNFREDCKIINPRVVGDTLVWTDGFNEVRAINIYRAMYKTIGLTETIDITRAVRYPHQFSLRASVGEQEYRVTINVRDQFGDPIIGVDIEITGTTAGGENVVLEETTGASGTEIITLENGQYSYGVTGDTIVSEQDNFVVNNSDLEITITPEVLTHEVDVTVTDESGRFLSGVGLTIQSTTNPANIVLGSTGDGGIATLSELIPDRYVLTASLSGYDQASTPVEVPLDTTASITLVRETFQFRVSLINEDGSAFDSVGRQLLDNVTGQVVIFNIEGYAIFSTNQDGIHSFGLNSLVSEGSFSLIGSANIIRSDSVLDYTITLKTGVGSGTGFNTGDGPDPNQQ